MRGGAAFPDDDGFHDFSIDFRTTLSLSGIGGSGGGDAGRGDCLMGRMGYGDS